MKIVRREGFSVYVAQNESGATIGSGKLYSVFLDGQELRGVCCGADEEQGFVDVLVQDDGTDEGAVAFYAVSKLPRWKIVDGEPVVKRLTGKVEIKLRTAA